MATVKFRKKLVGADGGKHPHAMNEQDYPPTVYSDAQRRAILRKVVLHFVGMLEVWGCGRQAEMIARAAALALVDGLDKESA